MELSSRLERIRRRLQLAPRPILQGRLQRIIGLTWEARGCKLATGQSCEIEALDGKPVEAEVMGFAESRMLLMPYNPNASVAPGALVRPLSHRATIPAGPAVLGRVIDGLGNPLDGKGPIINAVPIPIAPHPINPLQRAPICEPLDVGVRAINGLLTVGRGQRIGLFAGAGVGKSMLLGMMTRYTGADITVVGLVGERGREVQEFINDILGEEGLRRSVVVAAPADDSPVLRVRAAQTCTRIAEYFRDQGAKVLLLMDSLTRFAQAQREIALAIGELPVTRGYPPSTFARIPQLVERAGNGEVGGGSITAFYTVLTEGDDLHDPVSDAARAILDGHIILSRSLADAGHYPAIDIERSISRVMNNVVDKAHWQDALKFRRLYSTYEKSRELISIGAYQQGTDPTTDKAIAVNPKLLSFLSQPFNQSASFSDTKEALQNLPLEQVDAAALKANSGLKASS